MKAEAGGTNFEPIAPVATPSNLCPSQEQYEIGRVG